jgi:hypothetical protein
MQDINNKLVTVGKVSPRFTAIPVQLALPRALEKVPAGQSVSGRRKIVSIGKKRKGVLPANDDSYTQKV